MELEIAAYIFTGLLVLVYRQLAKIQNNLQFINEDIVRLNIEIKTLAKIIKQD